MGIFSNFFGGAKTESKPIQTPILTSQQQALLSAMGTQAQTGLAGPTSKAPVMSVPQTGQESTYFNWVNNLEGQKALKNLLSGTPGYEISPETVESYYKGSVEPTYMKEYNEKVLPALKAAYSGPGTYWGSPRAGAEAKAGSDLAYQLAKAKSDLQYQEEVARRASIDTAYGRVLPATEEMTNTYGQAGLYQRNIEHEKVMEDLQRYLSGEEVNGSYNAAYNPNVQLALAVLGIPAFSTGVETKSTGAGLGYQFLSQSAKGLAQATTGTPFTTLPGDTAAPSGTQYGLSPGQTWPTAGYGAPGTGLNSYGWGGADYLGGYWAQPALAGAFNTGAGSTVGMTAAEKAGMIAAMM